MPIGYIVGKQYRLNTEYDRWAKLEVFSKITRLAMQRGLSIETAYSHVGRNYSAEIKSLDHYSLALKNARTPLMAVLEALSAAFEKRPECDDVLMRVLFLEAECAELILAVADARTREAKEKALQDKLVGALDTLRTVIDSMTVVFMQGDVVAGRATIGHLRGSPIRSTILDIAPDFESPEDDARIAAVNAKPVPAGPDEDDDL